MAGRGRGEDGAAPRRRALVTHPGAELYGSDRMVLESVRGLLGDGWDVTVALPGPGPLADLLTAEGATCRALPVPVLRKSAASPRGLLALAGSAVRSAPAAWRLLREQRPDVVYSSTLTTPLWLLLARAARVPAVCHVHEAEGQVRASVRAVMTAPLHLAQRVVANSSHTRHLLLQSAPRLAARTTVVLNGVPSPEPTGRTTPADPAALDPAAPAAGRPLRLLFVGRTSERKGVGVLLDALELLLGRGVDAHLELVGDAFAGEPAARAAAQALLERTRSPRLSGAVTWRGFSDAVPDHLDACDALVVPAVQPESFGNTAVEGLLAGRPVVASAVGALPEVLHGLPGARLVPPGDAGALAEELVALAAELPVRRAEAQRGAAEAARRYDVARYRTEVVAVVREAAGLAGPAGARGARAGAAR